VSEHHQLTDTPQEREGDSTWDKVRRQRTNNADVVLHALVRGADDFECGPAAVGN